jgi:hypothetical protein
VSKQYEANAAVNVSALQSIPGGQWLPNISYKMEKKGTVTASVKVTGMKWSTMKNFRDNFSRQVRGNFPDAFARLGNLCANDRVLVTTTLTGKVSINVSTDSSFDTQALLQVGSKVAGIETGYKVISSDKSSTGFESEDEVVLALVASSQSAELGSLCQTKQCPAGCAECDLNTGACVHCTIRPTSERIRQGEGSALHFQCPGLQGPASVKVSGQVRTVKLGDTNLEQHKQGWLEAKLITESEGCQKNQQSGACYADTGAFWNDSPPKIELRAPGGPGDARVVAMRCDIGEKDQHCVMGGLTAQIWKEDACPGGACPSDKVVQGTAGKCP